MSDTHLNYGDDMLRFGIKPNPNGQVDPVVEVQWEVTPAAIERLADAKAIDAHVFIVTESDGKEVDRILVPLEARRWFVSLHRRGVSNIHACIVWSTDPKDRSAKRFLLSKKSHRDHIEDVIDEIRPTLYAIEQQIELTASRMGAYDLEDDDFDALESHLQALKEGRKDAYNEDYQTRIIPNLFENNSKSRGEAFQLGSARISVNVPAGMFADSWRITKKLGNLFFKSPRDQCQLRRRAILTAATSPIWIPICGALIAIFVAFWYTLGAAIVAIYSVYGSRNLNFGYFTWNSSDSPADIYAMRNPSRWWTEEVQEIDLNGYTYTTYKSRHPIFYFVNPPVILVIGVYISALRYLDIDWLLVIAPLIAIPAIAAIGIGLGMILQRRAESKPIIEPSAEAIRQLVIDQYSTSTNNGVAKVPVLHLKYLETKAKFCKPFERIE